MRVLISVANPSVLRQLTPAAYVYSRVSLDVLLRVAGTLTVLPSDYISTVKAAGRDACMEG